MKKNFLALVLMTSSALLQGMNNDGSVKWQTIAAVAGVATVGGVALWRATAPSDAQFLADLSAQQGEKRLLKYNQEFNTSDRAVDPESKLVENLTTKLGYADQFQDSATIKKQLGDDSQELTALKDSIWFRSFFNGGVATKWKELDTAEKNAVKLQPYIHGHNDYFVGWNKYKEHTELMTCIDIYFASPDGQREGQSAFLTAIRRHHLGSKGYPLLVVASKLLNDIEWIEKLRGEVYPQLKYNLNQLRTNFTDYLYVAITNNLEYDRELGLQRADDEEKRKQDLATATLLQAEAQVRLAEAANRQATIALQRVELDKKNLELKKQENERANINARVAELKRYGYSDRQIQAQLNSEGFARALIGLIFGSAN